MAKWKPLILFYVLTFLLLAVIPLAAPLFNGGSMDFDTAAASASAATGVAWTSNLWDVVRLAVVAPILWLVVFGSAIPAIAAILVMAFSQEPGKWGRLLRRFHPTGGRGISISSSLGMYALIFVAIVPALIVVFALRQATGGIYERGVSIFSVGVIPALLGAAFLDQGAVLEELGWRGFAANELQAKLLKPLPAALLVGLAWGLWHVPRDLTTGVVERLGVVPYLFLYLPSFVGGTIVVSVIAAFFMNRLGGSVIPAIMVHGLTNDAVGISGMTTIVNALTPYHQITKALPLAVVAVLLIILTRGMLGFEPDAET